MSKKKLKELFIEDLGEVTGGKGGIHTTLAVGEEGPYPTTLAVGEEDILTTMALGEEHATTLALGEEGDFPSL
ncbi:MAG: hypothetical protein ACRBN8_14640 [Nannocystales bacterium]